MIASVIMLVLLFYQTKTSLPGLVIVLIGVPVYYVWKRANGVKQDGVADSRG